MSTLTFDTLKFLDDLEKAQIPREQARAIVQIVRESHDSADVATKGDLRDLRKDVDLHFAQVEAKIDALENRLIIKLSIIMTGLISFAGAVLAVVNKLS